jgi:hypothetical protein
MREVSSAPSDLAMRPVRLTSTPGNLRPFDKVCVTLAIFVGISLLMLGVAAVLFGIFGVLLPKPEMALFIVVGVPMVLAGWGIIRAVDLAWRGERSARIAYVDSKDVLIEDYPCFNCCYNLRSLTRSARCPECGTPVAASADRFLLRPLDAMYRPTRERIERSTPQPPEDPVELDVPSDSASR